MVEKPKDLNTVKEHKLTKRRLMKVAVAAGISPLAASRLTVEDVKAADSDEVTISYDTEGQYKTTVPADWYERILKARDTNKEMQQRFSEAEGIADVGMRTGDTSGDNPYVFIALDKGSSKKEKRRGEIPEERNNTRIEVIERDVSNRSGDCDDSFYDADDRIPGGIRVSERNNNSYGTLTSQLVSGSDHNVPYGWATCVHVLSNCSNPEPLYHYGDGGEQSLGWVWLMDLSRDFAAIRPYSGVEARSDTVLPRYPNNSYFDHHVSGTLSRDGLERLMDRDGFEFELSGVSSCRNKAQVSASNTSKTIFDYDCANRIYDQVEWGSGDDAEGGDSGAPVISEPVEDAADQRFFSHMHSGSLFNCWGPAGYVIRNEWNLWWDDF